MSIAPWRQRVQNAILQHKNIAFSKFVQLATVSTDGFPRVRTVVFRGFFDSFILGQQNKSDTMVICTDLRSTKVEEVKSQSAAEVCWYFPISLDQYRLRGHIQIVDADAADPIEQRLREEVWKKQTPETRSMYDMPAPGTPCGPATLVTDGGGAYNLTHDKDDHEVDVDLDKYDAQKSKNPSPNFALLLLDVSHVDHVALPPPKTSLDKPSHRDSPHESILQRKKKSHRWIHTRNDNFQWSIQEHNP
eukprot:GFYU01033048.1.p1 GENE.GFYU01033048.1~~GFYU01033048.1.p1  ORF type:complete len:247 (-),score=59.78 GFYU01033048.1:107-847(-)